MSEAATLVSRLTVFTTGLLFGVGLTLSGMSNPGKVIGFLDLAGDWDPTLLLVMGGALAITLPAFHLILKRDRPLFDSRFHLPGAQAIDKRLISGALLFGLGWGIAGFCPGPAVAAVITLHPIVLLFLAGMLGGMLLHRFGSH